MKNGSLKPKLLGYNTGMRFPLFSSPQPQKETTPRTRNYSAILDATSFNLLALTPFVSAAQVVHEGTLNSLHATGISYPNYMRGLPFDKFDVPKYVEWAWDYKTRTFNPIDPSKVRAELRDRSLLAMAKIPAARRIMLDLNAIRHNARTGLDFQETVYMTKKMQALDFKRAGYPEDSIIDYPYVLQYADYAKLSLRQAADDIIFKSKLSDEILAQTELLRLKYFNRLKAATSMEEIPEIIEQFTKDCFHA